MDQSKLSPHQQDAIFAILKAAGQLSPEQGQSQAMPDLPAQQGVSSSPADSVDYDKIRSMFHDVTSGIRQQDGDKTHPMDAIQQIGNQMYTTNAPKDANTPWVSAPNGVSLATGPKIKQDKHGQLEAQTVTSAPLGHMLGLIQPTPVTGPNLFGAVQAAGATKFLGSHLPQMPDGTPFVDSKSATEAIAMLKATQNPNNPPVTKDEFIQTYGGTEKQWKAAGLADDGMMPFTKVRGLISKESADAMTARAANQKIGMLLQYGGAGAVKQAATDAYTRLSNLTRADGITNIIDQVQGGRATKRQRTLLQMEVARAINPSGVLTNEAVEHLATDSAGQKVNDWVEWLFNKSTPTQYSGFLTELTSLVDQEKAINRNLFRSANDMGLSVLRPSMPGGVHNAEAAMDNNPVLTPKPVTPPAPVQSNPLLDGYMRKNKIKDTPANRAWAAKKLGMTNGH